MKPVLFLFGCLAAAPAVTSRPVAQSSILSEDRSSDIAEQTEALTAYERTIPRADVRVNGSLGLETIDVVATRVPIDALLRRIARDCSRELVGLEGLSRMPEVTVKLVDTDLRDALSWIGGAVGLQITAKGTEIRVEDDLSAYPTRQELYERAYLGYLRALVDHPGSTMAPIAAWNRARIDESQPSRALEAAQAYDNLIEKYPNSDLIAKAMLRAGKLYGKANAWEEAAARFDALAGLQTENEFGLESRRLLADAHTRIAAAAKNEVVAHENARRALLVLDALDDFDETQDPEVRRKRYIVRSRAHSLAGEPVQAMRCLDLAIEYSQYGDQDPELAELRALAFEHADRNSDAVRAWLKHASLTSGETRQESYVRAAAAANRANQPLATIAIAKAASNEGFGDAVAPYADAALLKLDMEPRRIDLFGDAERIERGERLFLRGLYREAIEALRPVSSRQGTLDEEQRVRLATALAKALAKEKEIDDAILVLRTAVESLDRVTQRQSLYQLAATLLEQAGEIERAILALEGSL